MERIDNGTAIVNTSSETTVPTTTPVAEPKPAKRTRTVKTATPVAMPRTIADVVKIARTVNAANFAAIIAPINHGFVVNAPGKNVGRFTSTRVVHFQNTTLINNGTTKLTDVQLLFVWRVEFPSAVGRVFTADVTTGTSIVRGVRAELNRNGHGEPNRVPAGFKSEPYAATK